MRRNVNGFTLLEAIVAIVLIASVGMSLLAWINNSLASVSRVADRQREAEITRTALAYLETLNIAEQPQGSVEIGELVLNWSAELVEPERDGRVLFGGGVTPYRYGLYRVAARVTEADHQRAAFQVRLVGFKRVRQQGEGLL